MCQDCVYWQRAQAHRSNGLLFAPCALKPDTVVRDRRMPRGLDLQAYVTAAAYVCAKFTQRCSGAPGATLGP